MGVVTVTSTVPVPAGLTAVILVLLTDVTVPCFPPNNTMTPLVLEPKPEPVMVTVVSPFTDPLLGLMPFTVGGGK